MARCAALSRSETFRGSPHLSVKTLRHYHEVGLLAPAEVDARSGYRFYAIEQIATAQLIRQFRELDMPVESVREVLYAPDIATRNRLISAHLGALEQKLVETQTAVTSLRRLLDGGDAPIEIATRVAPAAIGIRIRAVVARAELLSWWRGALGELDAVVDAQGLTRTAPTFGLFASSLFQRDRGEVTLLVPVAEAPRAVGRSASLRVAAAELAVAEHQGAHDGIDVTYGLLGSHVAKHALGIAGPVRETYIVDSRTSADPGSWRTEIGWPIFATVR